MHSPIFFEFRVELNLLVNFQLNRYINDRHEKNCLDLEMRAKIFHYVVAKKDVGEPIFSGHK